MAKKENKEKECANRLPLQISPPLDFSYDEGLFNPLSLSQYKSVFSSCSAKCE